MFTIPSSGTRLLVDYFGTGGQVSLQHTHNFYGKANTLRFTASSIVSYPMGQVEARADLRVLALELSTLAGYRAVWRNLSFEPGTDGSYCSECGRRDRRKRDPIFGSGPTTDQFPFLEGRASLLLPFNDHMVGTAMYSLRFEDRQLRSFDWINSDLHDGGWFQRFEANLFFKHRDYGAIAPYVQMLRLRRQGALETGWAFGFNLMTRPGMIRHDDMLLLTFLIRPDDPYYGQHSYFAPVRALVIYRMQLLL